MRDLYTELLANAVTVPSPATDRLCAAARAANLTVAIGINERNVEEASGSTLYNHNPVHQCGRPHLGKHRKLVPTAGERLVHAQGDGSTLGDVPALHWSTRRADLLGELHAACPLRRMYAWGTQLYVAPTWDRGEPWLSTLRHIAKEGRVYVIGCCSAMQRSDIPDRFEFKTQYLPSGDPWINPGGSAIVNPDGKFIAGPIHQEQTILYAEVDLRQFAGPRWQLDVAGHAGRPEVLSLTVRRTAWPMVVLDDQDSERAY